MATTRTPGIAIGTDGRFFIDKRYRGVRIGMRIGATTQERAEQRLRTEMEQVDLDLACRVHPRPNFAECAARYLTQSQDMPGTRSHSSASSTVGQAHRTRLIGVPE